MTVIQKEHKYIGVISFFLLTNKCKMIDILYTTIYIFPAEQPDKDKIGHRMFIHILNKYYAFIVIIGLAYSFWWGDLYILYEENNFSLFFLHSCVRQTKFLSVSECNLISLVILCIFMYL
jgi:hypothetical protein